MGKTRDLFKKIRDTKGTFHAKMVSIKERNGMDLIEATLHSVPEKWFNQGDNWHWAKPNKPEIKHHAF